MAWRRGRRDDSVRTRRKILISTQVIAGADVDDVAARFLEGTPFHNDILDAGGEPLLQEARRLLASNVAGFDMVDLADHVPEWAGVDNPDGLAKGLLFPTNTCLYVTAVAP